MMLPESPMASTLGSSFFATDLPLPCPEPNCRDVYFRLGESRKRISLSPIIWMINQADAKCKPVRKLQLLPRNNTKRTVEFSGRMRGRKSGRFGDGSRQLGECTVLPGNA